MRKKFKNKNGKEDKISLATVFKDTFMALGISFKHTPLGCILMLASYLAGGFISFISNTYALKYVIDSYENGITFERVAKTVLLLFIIPAAIQLFIDFFPNLPGHTGAIK